MNEKITVDSPVWLGDQGEKILDVVRCAGEILLEYWKSDELSVEHKEGGSPVTQADQRAQAIINDGLSELWPSVPIVGEEASVVRSDEGLGNFFLVDPLDGTKEFIAGSEQFAICIAYVDQGRSVWGLIYAPASDSIVIGCSGYQGQQGAWALEGFRSGATIWSPCQIEVPGEVWRFLGSRFHKDPAETKAFYTLEQAGVTLENITMGSACKFIELAVSRAEGYLRSGPTCEWDIAAGVAIVEGAGGVVHNWEGQTLTFSGEAGVLNPPFVAGAPELVERVLSVIGK